MPEVFDQRKVFSLYEVALSIKNTIARKAAAPFWVKAEMLKLNYYKHSGHCYPDLVDKRDGMVVAQMRANLWANDYQRINLKFLRLLKEPLKEGISILFLTKVNFHPVHGLSLNILDIDPSYTLGELEKEKLLTIEKLKKDGDFERNKALVLPKLPQRIAVVSVESSKGYADFKNIIDHNEWGYAFFYMLFPSLLQGEKAVESIIRQLKRIEKVKDHFDLVAIIRGGGGDVGLSCFNHYELTKEIACFPLPVLTGIGHSTNETVCEMVAHRNNITPSKLAEFLIQQFHNFAVPLKEYERILSENVNDFLSNTGKEFINKTNAFLSLVKAYLQRNRQNLSNTVSLFKSGSLTFVKQEKSNIESVNSRLSFSSQTKINNAKTGLLSTEKLLKAFHPDEVLKRGYSIVYKDQKVITDKRQLKTGEELRIKLYKGEIITEVKKTKQ